MKLRPLYSLLLLLGTLFSLPTRAAVDYASFVDGAFPDGGAGHVFRGAQVPFGMMMWGPGWSGYSLTALSGAEMDWSYYDHLAILPSLGPNFSITRMVNGFMLKPPTHDASEPGYLRSEMKNGIITELTTTARTGISRFYFPKKKRAKLFFYLGTGENQISFEGHREVHGFITRRGIRLYFKAEFDRPYFTTKTWKNIFTRRGVKVASRINGAAFFFDTKQSQNLQMKISMSWVSEKNAELNLSAENADWDFEKVRVNAREAWNRKLSLIEVNGPLPQMRAFYTHLAHTFMHPNLANDVNGEYLGFDQRIHRVEPEHAHYANFSGWDIYRTWVQLISMLLPKEASDMVRSLIRDGQQSGGGLPIWPVENRETGTMAGGSSTPLIVNAYTFGAKDFDWNEAYRLMDHDESDPQAQCQGFTERPYLAEYLKLGFIPYTRKTYPGRVSASLVVDYNAGEFALAKFAESLGKADRARYYLKRSQNWRNIFNEQSKLLQPKDLTGHWVKGFDPTYASFRDKRGFDEGNAVSWTFALTHNLAGLYAEMGGFKIAEAKLDDHFTKLNDGSTFLPFPWMGKYAWIGNEPGFSAPYNYNWLGKPWKTQNLVRRELDEEFLHWVPGDDDLGALGAWDVWSSLGLYPMIPGVPGFAITSPYFERATIHLPENHRWLIQASGLSKEGRYIQALTLNGLPVFRSWLDLADFQNQDTQLNFSLSNRPNTDWGSGMGDLPPSFNE